MYRSRSTDLRPVRETPSRCNKPWTKLLPALPPYPTCLLQQSHPHQPHPPVSTLLRDSQLARSVSATQPHRLHTRHRSSPRQAIGTVLERVLVRSPGPHSVWTRQSTSLVTRKSRCSCERLKALYQGTAGPTAVEVPPHSHVSHLQRHDHSHLCQTQLPQKRLDKVRYRLAGGVSTESRRPPARLPGRTSSALPRLKAPSVNVAIRAMRVVWRVRVKRGVKQRKASLLRSHSHLRKSQSLLSWIQRPA